MSLPFAAISARVELPLLIAFSDLTRYTARASSMSDLVLAELLDEYYARTWRAALTGGGRVVKFIGDGALLLFPDDRVDDGVGTMLELKDECDAWFDTLGWDSRLVVKLHYGTAVVGPYGPAGHEHFDALGSNLNIAATIDTRGFALTAEAFRRLGPETRKRFKKHTPPISYIRVDDRRPHRTGRSV